KVHAELMAICQKLGITPPPEIHDEQKQQARGPAATLPPVTLDRWVRRMMIFEGMLARAYPNGPPAEQRKTLDTVKKHVAEISQLRSSRVEDQRKLEGLDQKVRDGRERFGHAVDALGVDASKAREVGRGAREGVDPYTAAVKQAKELMTQVHAEILHW